jgi:redox-sensing transcriptional repressor
MAEVMVIPKATISRLPVYFRALMELSHLDVALVSSEDLSSRAGVSSSQLRKDLSYFGEFGIRGAGYDVGFLISKIREILGITREWRLGIVGAGKLGAALARYGGFAQHGLEVIAMFDKDPAKNGKKIGKLEIEPIENLPTVIKGKDIQIGVIAVPAPAAQEVADMLVQAGIKGIWNFAPSRLEVPESIHVQYEDLVVGLLTLSHHISRTME